MKIIVTGGAGFIGCNFIAYMLQKYSNYKIICLDKLTYAGNIANLSTFLFKNNFKFIRVDICDRKAIYKIFASENPDMVINFAAESHVDRSIANPEVFLQTNVIGTEILLDACIKYKVKRYHQVSTDEVYGDLPLNRPDLLFNEDSPLKASSPYAASKASADLIVMAYQRTYGINVTISRCSNNYGPYQFPEKLIPLMIINALREKILPVYGDGQNIRDWIYVKDHCQAIDLILHKGNCGAIYNIGGNNEVKNIDVVKFLCNQLDKSEKLITYVADRKGHDLRYAMETKKIYRDLGWKAQTDFRHGLENTIKWYIQHRKWWEDILDGKYKFLNESYF